MTPEELRNIRVLIGRIEILDEQIERLRASVQRTSPKLDGMPRGGTGADVMAEYVAKLEDLQDAYIEASGKCLEELLSISDEINAKCTKKQAKVIMLRYKDGYTWEEVAEQMGAYDVRSVIRLHKRGIKRLFKNDHVMTTKNKIKC